MIVINHRRLLTATAVLFICGQAYGDATPTSSENDPQIDEIIVTAQRRDESLSQTPVSIAFVSADTLAKAEIVTENDLRTVTPGLQIRSGSNSNQINYSLRGETQDPFSNVRPGVLPYINEVQIGGLAGASTFYDLQSVQVLKGPQGTLFGRSATGGAVLFTTAKPVDEFGGYISGSYGDYRNGKVEGALNVPIIGDQLMARFAGFYRSRDGFQYNLYDDHRDGNQEQFGGRFSLTAQFAPAIRDEFVLDYLHSDSQNTTAVLSGLLPFAGAGAPYVPAQYLYSGTSNPLATVTGQCTLQLFAKIPGPCPPINPAVAGYYNGYFASPNHPANGLSGQLSDQGARGPYVIDSDAPNAFRANNTVLTNKTTFDLDNKDQIRNIFGFTSVKSFIAQDDDGVPYTLATSPLLTNDTRQYSDELQWAGNAFANRLTYVAGAYVSDENTRTQQDTDFFDIAFGGLSQTQEFRTKNRTYAGYSQGTYNINDAGLAFTLGERYTSERVGIETLPGDTARMALGDPAPPGFSYNQETTYNRLSWTIGLQDQVNPDLLFYIVSRRAYKSGGYNGLLAPRIGGANVAGNSYLAERVLDAEVGSKFNGKIAGMPARLDVALYYSWIDNSQRAAFTLVDGGPVADTVNVPTGTTYGSEVDGLIKPLAWLTVGASANYTKAAFGSTPVSVNGVSQVFDQVPDTPIFSGSVYADAVWRVNGHLSASLHGDVYDQSQSFTTPRSADSAGARLVPYSITNFRVGIEDENAGWSVTANLKNAFDKVYYVGGVATGEIYQINLLIPAEPRTYTVEVRYKF